MSSQGPETYGRSDGGTDRLRTDWTRAPSVSMAVVEAVASATDVDPLELDPLNDVIDPDALDSLFSPPGSPEREPVHQVSLRFGGRHVTVHGTGELVVRPDGPAAGS